MNKSIIFYDSTTNLINPKDKVFDNKNLVEIFIESNESIDQVLSKAINGNLIITEFTNIIIPACFGDVLSDFLGLRFASHIRCTPGINQESNIFLYSFTRIQDYFSNECFNILRTKGVCLINYDVETILNAVNSSKKYLLKEDLIDEVAKLKIDVPLNYEDNHSIANEWAIYRWANTINTFDNDITKIEYKLENDLYYKYLKTIYPVNKIETIDSVDLQLDFEGNPTVLYIDDEAEKGWKEIFSKIIMDVNKIDFIHLDNEFNGKSKSEIVDISINEVIKEEVDLVILDFRLCNEDFDCTVIQDITGYQILKKIKEHNKGVQVIVFSATNKIWNLQALQEAGVDGFIIKESPEYSNDSSFTKKSVLDMIQSMDKCLNMIFLKDIYINIEKIKKHVNTISNSNKDKGLDGGLMKMKFKNEIFIQLDIIYDCLKKSSENISTVINDNYSYLNLSFVSIFKLIELINDYHTDYKGIKLKSNDIKIQNYNQNTDLFEKIEREYPTTRDKIMTIIKFELNSSPKQFINNINLFIKFRNNIIHPKTLKDYKKASKEENLAFLTLLGDLIIKIK